MSRVVAEAEEATMPVADDLHVLRRRGGGRRWAGISLVIVVLLLLGWFGTKLAFSGWQISKENFFKDLFTFSGTTLTGEADGRVNVVLMGIPGAGADGPNLTDTLIVASLATKPEEKSFLFSLPRDLSVKVAGYGDTKINTVYEVGNARETGGGGKLVEQTVGEILGISVSYFARIDFSGFEKLIDELGGISITVDKDLHDDQYPGPNSTYQVVDIKAGTYNMDGATALKYARSRQSTSDFDRARRQQQVIVAVRAKAEEQNLLVNPAKAITILDLVTDHLETNLKLTEMKRFITLFKDLNIDNLVTKVFDDSATGLLYANKVNEIYVLQPVGDNYTQIQAYVQKVLSGEAVVAEVEQQVSREPLKVEVLNGTNVTGLAKKIATQLEASGYKIVATGNNATKGIAKTIVYDLSDGVRRWEVQKLAESLKAELSTEKLTTTTGALARVVLGADVATN